MTEVIETQKVEAKDMARKNCVVLKMSINSQDMDCDLKEGALRFMSTVIKGVVQSVRDGLLVGVKDFASTVKVTPDIFWGNGGNIIVYRIGFEAAGPDNVEAMLSLVRVVVLSQTSDPDYPQIKDHLQMVGLELDPEGFTVADATKQAALMRV